MSVAEAVLIIGAIVTVLGGIGTFRLQRAQATQLELEAATKREREKVTLSEQMQAIATKELTRYAQQIDDMQSDLKAEQQARKEQDAALQKLQDQLDAVKIENSRLRRHGKSMIDALEEYFRVRCLILMQTEEDCITCVQADIKLLEKLKEVQFELEGDTSRVEILLNQRREHLQQHEQKKAPRNAKRRLRNE